jgi:hypothetical protein
MTKKKTATKKKVIKKDNVTQLKTAKKSNPIEVDKKGNPIHTTISHETPESAPSKDKSVKDAPKEPTSLERKNKLITSAVDDCRIIIAAYKKLQTERPLVVSETFILFDAFVRLAEIYDRYGIDKQDAVDCINEAINIGTNVLDMNMVSNAILFRSSLKIKLSNVI